MLHLPRLKHALFMLQLSGSHVLRLVEAQNMTIAQIEHEKYVLEARQVKHSATPSFAIEQSVLRERQPLSIGF